jgi:methionyl-tRNA synthetase
MESVAPWSMAPGPHLKRVVYLLAEALRVVGILLQPYMPEKASHLLDMVGVKLERRTLQYATTGADDDYGTPMVDLGRGHSGALFPPIVEE